MNTQKVSDHIVKWLKDYAENAGVNGFVSWNFWWN